MKLLLVNPNITGSVTRLIGDEARREHMGKHDAAIIAAFGDPGRPALRDAVDRPVVGLTEAALATASWLGNRSSIIAISRRITARVPRNGRRLRFRRAPGERARARPADSLILTGAPLAGLARRIEGELPVPLVDPIAAAVKQAEVARTGAFTPPPAKANAGLHS